MCLPPQCWDYRHGLPPLLFPWMLGIRTQGLMLVQQTLSQLSHLPSLSWNFKLRTAW